MLFCKFVTFILLKPCTKKGNNILYGSQSYLYLCALKKKRIQKNAKDSINHKCL